MAIAAFGIIRKEDKILLVKITEPFREAHKWNFPGGVIEHGESIEDGLKREIYEETTVVVDISSQIDTFEAKDPDNTIHIFMGNYLSGDIEIQEFELEDCNWFTLSEALRLPLAFNIEDYILVL